MVEGTGGDAMKLVNLEQQIFVPVVDETHGGVTVEMQMTVGEFFAKCCDGFEPEVVEAIPVEWLKAQNDSTEYFKTVQWQAVELILELWEKEQEAQDD
jgi:hypothetical protein